MVTEILILLCNEPSPTAAVRLTAGKHSAQWALDDVLIGVNDSSQTGFQDNFDGLIDLQANWYGIQGGQVDIDCLSMDTALVFTENIGLCCHHIMERYLINCRSKLTKPQKEFSVIKLCA